MDTEPTSEDSTELPAVTQEQLDALLQVAFEVMPMKLGYVETEDSLALRAHTVEAIRSGDLDEGRRLLTSYNDAGIAIVEAIEDDGDAYARGQLGLMLAMAQIYIDSGRIDRAIEALDDAEQSAYYGGLTTYAAGIIHQINHLRRMPPPEAVEMYIGELNVAEIQQRCSDIIAPEDLAELEGIDAGDLVGALIGLMQIQGIEDPGVLLVRRGILK